jgi:hypothetical protein
MAHNSRSISNSNQNFLNLIFEVVPSITIVITDFSSGVLALKF